jgi:sialate O-acetylesterase
MKTIFLSLLLTVFSLTLFADVKLPRIFGDNMVLQRDQKIQVWGWAAPKEKITVQFHDQVKKVTADKSGKWKISLDAEAAGGTLHVYGEGQEYGGL